MFGSDYIHWSNITFYPVWRCVWTNFLSCFLGYNFHLLILIEYFGHLPMRHMFTKVKTSFLRISSTFMMFSVVSRKLILVFTSKLNTYLNNLICMTSILEIFVEGVLRYTLRPYFVLGYISIWYNCCCLAAPLTPSPTSLDSKFLLVIPTHI